MSFFSLLKRIFNHEKYMEELIAHRVGEVKVYLDSNYHPEPKPVITGKEPANLFYPAEDIPAGEFSAEEPAENPEEEEKEDKEETPSSPPKTSSKGGAQHSRVSIEDDDNARLNVRYSITSRCEPTYRADIDYERLRSQLDEIMGQNRGAEVLKTVRSAPLQTFVEYLRYHIYRQGLTGPQVYRAAQIDKRLYSKIISNTHHKPSRETAIALAIATRLNLDQAKTLLSRAGYTLSETNRRDLILTYFFQNEIRNLIEINGILDTLGEAPIGRG